MNSLVWFITGASRGFGLEIARAALARGDLSSLLRVIVRSSSVSSAGANDSWLSSSMSPTSARPKRPSARRWRASGRSMCW